MESNHEIQEAMENLKKAVTTAFEAFREIAKLIKKFFNDSWNGIKEFLLLNEERIQQKQFHRRSFTRQKILHQVYDRRPKQIIRKIIR